MVKKKELIKNIFIDLNFKWWKTEHPSPFADALTVDGIAYRALTQAMLDWMLENAPSKIKTQPWPLQSEMEQSLQELYCIIKIGNVADLSGNVLIIKD